MDKRQNISAWRLATLSTSLCLGLFLSLLDTTIVATIVYTLGTDFRASPTLVDWTVLSYTLAYVGCAVIYANLSNTCGRRNANISALVIFVAFSFGSGFAQNIQQLIIFRTFQGIGGSGLYALTLVILPEIAPPRMRPWIGSIIGMVVAVSGVLGPVLGGAITRYTTWRWAFWMNGPIGLVALILFVVAWPPTSQFRTQPTRSIRKLDILGCILLIAASVLCVFAFQEAGLDTRNWHSAIFPASLVVGIFCWIALFGWEYAIARYWENSIDGIIPIRLLKHRVFASATVVTMLTGFTYFIVVYSIPSRFEIMNLKSPLGAGLGILPLVGASAVGSMLCGYFTSKKDLTFYLRFVGSCLVLIGAALLTTLINTIKVQNKIYGFQVFVGLGFGLVVAGTSIMVSFEVERRDSATAQGVIAQFRILGGSLGIAASSAIRGAVDQRELGGPVSPQTTASLTPVDIAIRQSYTDAFNESMMVCTVVAGVSLLASLWTYRKNPKTIQDMHAENFELQKLPTERGTGTRQ